MKQSSGGYYCLSEHEKRFTKPPIKKPDEEQVCGKQDFGAALSLFYTTVYHRHLRSISGARMRSIERSS